MLFQGLRGPNQRKYHYLTVEREDTAVIMMIDKGGYGNCAGLKVDPATARTIAAELVALADEAEGVKP